MGSEANVAPIESVRTPKLTEVVADVLRRRILTGTVSEGDNLPPEQELAAQLGVSRPTLREVLRVLESESLIRPRRGSRDGAMVTAPSIASAARYFGYLLQYSDTTLEDLAIARLMLEPPLVARLASNHTDDDLIALRGALSREQTAIDAPGEFRSARVRFHEVACTLAGVETMSIFVRELNWVLRRLAEEHRASVGKDGRSEAATAHRAHTRLFELVESGDAEQTREFWYRHVSEVDKKLLFGHEGQRVVDLFS
jgi:GntR family transcriptional regulator, transcriptional repressor for pyruvate dehydrogenase complex